MGGVSVKILFDLKNEYDTAAMDQHRSERHWRGCRHGVDY
jgi:hypothetical protein